jgi:hypothetical protein
MGHGMGAQKDVGLGSYGERFSRHALATLVVDYRWAGGGRAPAALRAPSPGLRGGAALHSRQRAAGRPAAALRPAALANPPSSDRPQPNPFPTFAHSDPLPYLQDIRRI